MALNRINSYSIDARNRSNAGIKKQNNGSSLQVQNNKVSFAGRNLLTSGSAKTLAVIESGGLAASFVTQDVLGTIIPRISTELNRNRKKGDPPNYAAGGEVAIREIFTGPIMFVIPIALFGATKKVLGKASFVPIESLKSLKKNFNNVLNNAHKNGKFEEKALRTNFYKDVLTDSLGKNSSGTVNSVVEKLLHNDELQQQLDNTKFYKHSDKKALKKQIKGNLGEINDILVAHNHSAGTSTREFGQVHIGKESMAIGDFVDRISNYATDVVNKSAKTVSNATKEGKEITLDHLAEFAEKITKRKIGQRFISTSIALAASLTFCALIPKFYARNKSFPGSVDKADNSKVQDK